MTGRYQDWLLTAHPTSRRQAAWGHRYRIWLRFENDRPALAALAVITALSVVCICAPLLGLQDPELQVLASRVGPPSATHWLGTDELGRDMLARLIFGGRASLGLTTAILLLAVPVGMLVGAFAGFIGGFVDLVLMRMTDVFLAFPRLVMALALLAALKPGAGGAICATALTSWPVYARITRSQTLKVRNSDFILAVRLTGAGSTRVVLRHIAPLCLPSIIVRATLDGGRVMLTIATLGFLGMGVQPPAPEWGAMIADSRDLIVQEWWVPVFPSVLIFLTVLASTVVGDGLRDALDPQRAI